MTLYVDPIELQWFLSNLLAVTLTTWALVEAHRDVRAVQVLNGRARQVGAQSNRRRELIRLATQVTLLLVVVPGLFAENVVRLSVPVALLILVPWLLLLNTLLDLLDRRRIIILVRSEAAAQIDRIEEAAETAAHESTVTNERIAGLEDAVRDGP